MIEGDVDGAEGAETIGSSGGELGLVVEALAGAAGDRALGPEPVEQQPAMAAEHAGDFISRLTYRSQHDSFRDKSVVCRRRIAHANGEPSDDQWNSPPLGEMGDRHSRACRH